MSQTLPAWLMLAVPLGITANLWAGQPTTLQKKLKDLDVHASWIYNDLAAGFKQAKKTGKPLLVVFR